MDINAHLKDEIVLNEDENEEEKRFNEIICYDSEGDSSQENEPNESVVVYNEIVLQNVQPNQQYGSVASTFKETSDIQKAINAERMRKYRARQRILQRNIQRNVLYQSPTLPCRGRPKHDSAIPDHEGRPNISEKRRFITENLPSIAGYISRRSNAAQMRKYRAKQRSDPVRYQQYLERERIRNYKRKYEKRIEAAQERAIEMGIPYVVLEPEGHRRRGRKPKFPEDDVTLVLPAKYEDESNSFNSDDMPMIPVKVELQESDEIYQERKPAISVVNINKLMNYPRSALQTLYPQEVHDRERVNNFIKLEHDYVKKESDHMDPHKLELLKLQQQCRNFVLDKAIQSGPTKRKRERRFNSTSTRKVTSNFVHNDCDVHEDLDDLFKELAEVANKEPPKKIHSTKISPRQRSPHKKSPQKQSPRPHSSKTSPRKKSPHKKSPKRSPLKQLPCEGDGEFSLTVSMPVQPLIPPNSKSVHSKRFFDTGRAEGSHRSKRLFKKIVSNESGVFDCNEDSIEIKQEPIDLDDIKQEPIQSDDNLF